MTLRRRSSSLSSSPSSLSSTFTTSSLDARSTSSIQNIFAEENFRQMIKTAIKLLPEFELDLDAIFTRHPNVSILDKILIASEEVGYNRVRIPVADFLQVSPDEVDKKVVRDLLLEVEVPSPDLLQQLKTQFGIDPNLFHMEIIRENILESRVLSERLLSELERAFGQDLVNKVLVESEVVSQLRSESELKVVIRYALKSGELKELIKILGEVFGQDFVTDTLIEMGIGRQRTVTFGSRKKKKRGRRKV